MMKYLSVLILIFGFLLSSCDGEEMASTKNIEGHWIYAETKPDVYATDSSIKKKIEEYIENKNAAHKISYEFKNDKTYYCYQNNDEPIKGIFKVIDKNYFTIDNQEEKEVKNIITKDSIIYITYDIKKEIAKELNIDERKIIKANATEIFKRGLFGN